MLLCGDFDLKTQRSGKPQFSFLVRHLKRHSCEKKIDIGKNMQEATKEAQEVVLQRTVAFKTCPLCGKVWNTIDEFLSDTELHLNGYQGNMKRLLDGRERYGLLLFTHRSEQCGTTLAFEPSVFKMKLK
jgi:hypothetical protein